MIYNWYGSTYGAENAVTLWRTMTLPALPSGTWYLFHVVDKGNHHSEVREDDNVSREALRINVVPC